MKIKNKDMVLKLYNENLSQNEIAEILGVGQSRISEIIREFGLKRDKSVLRLNRVKIDIDYFKIIDNEEKAYWLGFICADGNINKTNNKVTLTSKDLEVIEKFKYCVGSEHKISHSEYLDKRTHKNYKRYTIQITTKPFALNLINLEVTKNKTNNLIFPNIDEKFYSYFISGLFDGDGTICHRSSNNQLLISLISTNEIINFIQQHIKDKLGINKTKVQRVTHNGNVYKMLLYDRKDVLKFLKFIYNKNFDDLYLKRKYEIFKKEII